LTDQPELVAEAILDFITDVVGKKNMGDIFLGYWQDDIWHGHESTLIKRLREIYGIKLDSIE